MRRLKLLGQRMLVAVVGLVTVWLILVLFYDVADRRLPLVLALASTYAAAAYLILPRAIRLGAHILNRGRVPAYTLTGDGLPGDPVNLILIGTFDELRRAFAQAGWTQADPLGLGSSWRMACAFVLNRPYPSCPLQHALPVRPGAGRRFPALHRRQPAQAPPRSLLGPLDGARGGDPRHRGLLARVGPAGRS